MGFLQWLFQAPGQLTHLEFCKVSGRMVTVAIYQIGRREWVAAIHQNQSCGRTRQEAIKSLITQLEEAAQ